MRKPLLLFAAAVLLASSLHAAVHVWTGAAGERFSDPSNWIGGTPSGDSAPDLSFPAGARLTAINDLTGLVVHTIAISGTGYVIAGNPITFDSAQVIDSTAGPNTISCDLVLANDTVFDLSLGSINAEPGGGHMTLSGAIGGPGGLVLTGDGVLALAGGRPNSYSGTTRVFYGELQLRKPAGVTAIAGPLRLEIQGLYQYGHLSTFSDEQIADTAPIFVCNQCELGIGAFETIGPLTIDGSGRVQTSTQWSGGIVSTGTLVLAGDIHLTGDYGGYGMTMMGGNLVLSGARTIFTTYGPDTAQVSGLTAAAGASLTIRTEGTAFDNFGPQTLSLSGSYNANTTVDDGRVALRNAATPVLLHGGDVAGSVFSITADGGNLDVRSYAGGLNVTTDVLLSPATTVTVDDIGGNTHSIQMNGTLNLAGAQLQVLNSPSTVQRQLGATYTLINNASASPVSGTFAGLPEGTLIGDRLRISYVGGDGNDVTLTEAGRLGSTTSFTYTPSYPYPTINDPITLQAQIAVASTSPVAATGTVTFATSTQVLATVPVSGNTASATITLPLGSYPITVNYSGDGQVQPSAASGSIAVAAPKPLITAIDPATVAGGSTTTLRILGSGFLDGGYVVIGSSGLATTFVSSTELQVAYTAPNPTTSFAQTVSVVQPGSLYVTSDNATFTITPSPPPPPPPFTFEQSAVSVSTITPGAMTAWNAVMRGGNQIWELENLQTDDDNDGVVRWQLNTNLLPFGLWTVMDLSARTILSADPYFDISPAPHPFPQKMFVRDAAGNYAHVIFDTRSLTDSLFTSVMWARPGVGAWSLVGTEGAGYDADATSNHLLVFDVSAMQPVGNSPPAPSGVAAGDLFDAVDTYGQSWIGDRVDDHLAESAGPGQVRFAADRSVAGEEVEGVVHIVLLRVGGSDGAVSVNYATSDGTAVAGVHYTAESGTAVFNPGEILKTIDIPLINDSIYSGPTQFSLSLSGAAGTTIAGASTLNITITDDDPMPVVSLHPSSTQVMEGDSGTQSFSVDVVLQGATRLITTAVAGYTSQPYGYPISQQLVFAPGETHKTFNVQWTGNTLPEPDHLVSLFIGTVTNGTAAAPAQMPFTIVDDDVATGSISDVSVSESVGSVQLRLNFFGPNSKPFTVSYATSDGSAAAGSDYVATSGTLSNNSPTITIPIINDATTEGPEWFAVTLTNPSGVRLGRSTAIVEIIDDDATPGAPVAMNATAAGPSSVQLSWLPVQNASWYDVYRSSGAGAFAPVAYPASTAMTDVNLSANTTYIYKVRALLRDGTYTPFSSVDVATTTTFTDDPVIPGATAIKAVHFSELLTAVNAMRAAAGLSAISFTAAPVAGSSPLASQINQLRSALNEARAAIGVAAVTYADPILTSSMPVKAAHVQEIRDGCK